MGSICGRGNGGNTVSGKVSLLSGNNLGGLGGGNGTVGIGDEGTMRVTVVSVESVVSSVCTVVSVPSSVSVGISGINTLGGKVSNFSCDDLGGLGRGNGTTGVGDELDSRGSSHAGREENQKLHV